MSERLVIRLGSNSDERIFWLQYNDKAQEVIASGVLNNAFELAQLTQQAAAVRVQVLVPGSDLNYFSVDVPKSNRRQAIAAIPFMLEDELANDVESLHFVYGKVVDDKQSVYVCDKAKVEMWLAWLGEANIQATELMPDYLALPIAEGERITALQLEEQVLLRVSPQQGYCITQDWLSVTLGLLSHEGEPLTIEHLDVPEGNQLIPHQWQALPLILPMQQLAMQMSKPTLNLLVGEFTQNKQTNNHFKVWRGVAIAASLLVVLFFTEQLIRVNQLEQQQAALKEQSENIYRKINPNVRRIIGLKSNMKKELEQLQGGGGSQELLIMLDSMNNAFSAVSSMKPVSIKYDQRRHEIRVQAHAESYEKFNQFRDILASQYTVTTGGLNNDGSRVSGSLVMKVSS